MVTVRLKWNQGFMFWWIRYNVRLLHLFLFPNLSINVFSNIEIWENTGNLTAPNYQETLLDNFDDHDFFGYDYGEILRINRDQCDLLNP